MIKKLEDQILEKIKNRSIFSEYLPKSYCMDYSKFNIYGAGGSYKDYIEPYSYTMSRLGQRGDRRKISLPEPSAYVSLVDFLTEKPAILNYFAILSIGDENSFSRIVNSDKEIVDYDGGYSRVISPLGLNDSGDVTQEEEKQRSIFIRNMLVKIDKTKGARGILHIDISEFYRSVYTHAIPAIKLGVDKAQEDYVTSSKDSDYALYVNLDKQVRSLNGKKTNGLLTGPYISKILAEAILAKVDEELIERKIVFTRYADDYEIAIFDKEDISKIKSTVSNVLDRFFLKINNEKTRFEEYPFYIFSNFENALELVNKEKKAVEIVELFNRFWAFEKHGEKGAVRYLLKAYQNKYSVSDKKVYVDYLINVLCNDEKALNLVCEILISEYENKRIEIDEDIHKLLLDKMNIEIRNDHELEVIWFIYVLRYTGYDIKPELIERLLNTNFELVKVLIINECEEKISGGILKKAFENGKSWILLYEITRYTKEYDMFYNKIKIKSSKNFYKALFENDYSFYAKRCICAEKKEKEIPSILSPFVNPFIQ